jgi:alpha-glucosidase
MMVEINTDTGNLAVYDSQGNVIIKDFVINTGKQGFYKNAVQLTYDGDQVFYGISGYAAGDTSEGITRSSVQYTVKAGEQGYSGGPFVWTNSGYGLLVDSDGGNIKLDNKSKQIIFQNSSRPDNDAYLMIGTPTNIISSLTEVTGQAPMFPKWAMGFTNSQWGTTEDSILDIIKTYRDKNIPIDNFTLDFDWKAWGEDNYGEFRWNDANFPDGSSGKFAEMLSQMGVKLTGILKPRIHVDTEQGDFITKNNWWLTSKGFSNDYFSGLKVGDIDFSIPEAREWYFNKVYEGWQTGFAGWWLDEADASSPNFQFLNMERALYEGYRKVSNERVWSINRNFYVGAQKYAYGMWSGDIGSGFYNMKEQRDRMLSAINLGEAKWGMDTGGFNGNPNSENYARWMQFSALTPIFRVHGQRGDLRQPWIYGETAEKAAAKAINLRYSLIPYIYSYERRAYEQGIGLVKPLVFDYPQDKNVENDVDAWMFGDYFLVSPVMKEGASSIDIYLPEGKWTDYEKGTVYEGNQTISYPLDSTTWQDIPMFMKEGAIIATQDVMNYIGEKPVDKVYVNIFPSVGHTGFDFYDDDGHTYDYENGAYFKQTITQQELGDNVTVTVSKAEGTYSTETKYYVVKIHGSYQSSTVNGTEIKSVSVEEELLAADEECTFTGEDVYGAYTAVKIRTGEEKELILKK